MLKNKIEKLKEMKDFISSIDNEIDKLEITIDDLKNKKKQRKNSLDSYKDELEISLLEYQLDDEFILSNSFVINEILKGQKNKFFDKFKAYFSFGVIYPLHGNYSFIKNYKDKLELIQNYKITVWKNNNFFDLNGKIIVYKMEDFGEDYCKSYGILIDKNNKYYRVVNISKYGNDWNLEGDIDKDEFNKIVNVL